MKRLEKKSSEASNEGTDEEDSDKEPNHAEESDNECKARKDRSLASTLVKAQLGGGSHKTHLYIPSLTQR